jgi:ankyrin repeat protein
MTSKFNLPAALAVLRTSHRAKLDDLLLEFTEEGNLLAIQALLDAGANVNAQGPSGWTSLHRAAYNGSTSIAGFLIDEKAQLEIQDIGGRTALHLAALQGHTKTTVSLITQGANVDAKDNDGRTPLHLAALRGQTPTVEALIAIGAAIDGKDNEGWTPQDLAARERHACTSAAFLQHPESPLALDNVRAALQALQHG